MGSNILKRPKTKANLGRNGYDLGRHRGFTSPCGMLLPIFTNFAYAGEKVKINTSTFIRTEALQTAAFVRLRHHVDWFFVPAFNIFQFWNEFYNSVNDVHTSFVDLEQVQGESFKFPSLDLEKHFYSVTMDNTFYGKRIEGQTDTESLYFLTPDEFGVPKYWNARRLADLFGYGSADYHSVANKWDILPWKYLAYHSVYYSHYNNSMFFKNDSKMYNCDVFYGSSYETAPAALGGNDYADKIVSTIHYRPFKKDYFTNIQPTPTITSAYPNLIGIDFQQNIINQSLVNTETFGQEVDPKAPHAGAMLAVASDSYYGPFVEFDGTLSSNAITVGTLRSLYAIDKLLRITANTGSHYDQQTLAHLGFEIPKGISKEPYFLGSQSFDIVINEVVATATTATEKSGSASSVSGAGTVIGDIAGKAFGSTGKENDIEFIAPCEGVFIGISSIEPLASYASMGIETENRYLSAFDFWRPEFDNLGMQPMFDDMFYVGNPNLQITGIHGWTYRWAELKTSFDVVNEGFFATSKRSWVNFKQDNYSVNFKNFNPLFNIFYIRPQYTNPIFLANVPNFAYIQNPSYGDRNGFAAVIRAYGNDMELWHYTSQDYERDGIVEHYYGCDAPTIYESDNFLIDMDIKFFKSSPMSCHSLPDF